jgi:hypothetical protein
LWERDPVVSLRVTTGEFALALRAMNQFREADGVPHCRVASLQRGINCGSACAGRDRAWCVGFQRTPDFVGDAVMIAITNRASNRTRY